MMNNTVYIYILIYCVHCCPQIYFMFYQTRIYKLHVLPHKKEVIQTLKKATSNPFLSTSKKFPPSFAAVQELVALSEATKAISEAWIQQ